jgi:hypothetical protein
MKSGRHLKFSKTNPKKEVNVTMINPEEPEDFE